MSVTNGDSMSQLMKSCLDILSDDLSRDPLKECAVGILSNMTCNNSTYKVTVIENDGVGILIDTITRFVESKFCSDFSIVFF